MKPEVKVFILRMIVILFGLLGVAQFAAFATGDCEFFRMVVTVPVCFALSYEAYFGAERVLRARRMRAISLRILHNANTTSRVA